jgi:hypothetical protein
MILIDSHYVYYNGGFQLALTQAIGHNNRTGICPEEIEIPILNNKTYRIFMASDGVSDMLSHGEEETLGFSTLDCTTIAELAEIRWRQTWYAVNEAEPTVITSEGFSFTESWQFDDISVGAIDISPL